MGESNTPTIYRYKLSIEAMDEITTFSKIHQYDDRHTYKEAWNMWKGNHEDFISAEAERLMRLGYVGSVEDKMYKAGRYYFRKKSTTETKVRRTRRCHVPMDMDVIEAMDIHIRRKMSEDEFTPAAGYSDFCEGHIPLLGEEIRRICREDPSSAQLLVEKFKKTYKNRYYLLSRSRN